MVVTDLLDEAADAGARVILNADRIGLRGDPIAVRDWAPRLRPYRTALLAVLRQREAGTYKHWTVRVPGRAVFGMTCCQGCTRDELLQRYPSGTTATPIGG